MEAEECEIMGHKGGYMGEGMGPPEGLVKWGASEPPLKVPEGPL